ncbi:hypothetical protein FF38_03965 [Lucilia cuprina]|uniref:Uncharacterized protein n=1 Tax=Lucilia cuprina TaxID=7375 RepID=A0A0L0CDL1_LUCCU|nr:hypothetical protein FF38_03965 [Lucilia cuprina]
MLYSWTCHRLKDLTDVYLENLLKNIICVTYTDGHAPADEHDVDDDKNACFPTFLVHQWFFPVQKNIYKKFLQQQIVANFSDSSNSSIMMLLRQDNVFLISTITPQHLVDENHSSLAKLISPPFAPSLSKYIRVSNFTFVRVRYDVMNDIFRVKDLSTLPQGNFVQEVHNEGNNYDHDEKDDDDYVWSQFSNVIVAFKPQFLAYALGKCVCEIIKKLFVYKTVHSFCAAIIICSSMLLIQTDNL